MSEQLEEVHGAAEEKPLGSLRTFHVFFVWACGILAFLFGIWALSQFVTTGGSMNAVMAVAAFCFAALVAFYGRWFLHKVRRMHIT